jgi:broad specificity phosphatase PhoE
MIKQNNYRRFYLVRHGETVWNEMATSSGIIIESDEIDFFIKEAMEINKIKA